MNAAETAFPTGCPLPPVHEWRIHLGAHKTATTHLQDTLAAVRPQLAARGVDFIPRPLLRESGLARELNRRRISARLPGLRGRLVERVLSETLAPLRRGPGILVLSEEKLIGGSQHAFATPLYPLIEHVVPLLASLRARAEVTLFLAIRAFDTHLPSAYVQELKVLPPPEGGFAALKERVLATPPSWFHLARRIRHAAPGIALRVWRQEDYRGHKAAILRALCGRETGPLPEIPDPVSTRSPALGAIRAAEALPRDLGVEARRARVREIFARAGEGPRFQPFSEAERVLLRAAYAADLERIAALGPDVLMRFEAAAAA